MLVWYPDTCPTLWVVSYKNKIHVEVCLNVPILDCTYDQGDTCCAVQIFFGHFSAWERLVAYGTVSELTGVDIDTWENATKLLKPITRISRSFCRAYAYKGINTSYSGPQLHSTRETSLVYSLSVECVATLVRTLHTCVLKYQKRFSRNIIDVVWSKAADVVSAQEAASNSTVRHLTWRRFGRALTRIRSLLRGPCQVIFHFRARDTWRNHYIWGN